MWGSKTLLFTWVIIFWWSLLDRGVSSSPLPHILVVIIDDWGWANVGYRASNASLISTPTLDRLAREGRILNRHYAHYTCSPTRTAFQTGRLPVHVQSHMSDVTESNTGIPRNMTTIAEKLQAAGYATHFVGKWDCGMATPQHLPINRGYNSSFHYFSTINDYWTQANNANCHMLPSIVDLWENDQPARQWNGTDYEDTLFGNHIHRLLDHHDPATPLFLVYAPHIANMPLQVPQPYLDKFAAIRNNDETECRGPYVIYPPHYQNFSCRQQLTAMLNFVDDQINNITSQLQSKGMWDNLLMLVTSDNGGNIELRENAGNNYPLRGGKYTAWEGGIRVNAMVSGGLIPPAVRGTTVDEMIHIADWYATFSGLAHVDPTDYRALQYHLPHVESLDMWPLISGQNHSSPRVEIPIDAEIFIQGRYKLMLRNEPFAVWTSPLFPNRSSSSLHYPRVLSHCAKHGGCVYDVVEDPTEQHDLSAEIPGLLGNLTARLVALRRYFWQNQEMGVDSCPAAQTYFSHTFPCCACYAAKYLYGGYFGPWQFLPSNQVRTITNNSNNNNATQHPKNIKTIMKESQSAAAKGGVVVLFWVTGLVVGVCILGFFIFVAYVRRKETLQRNYTVAQLERAASTIDMVTLPEEEGGRPASEKEPTTVEVMTQEQTELSERRSSDEGESGKEPAVQIHGEISELNTNMADRESGE